MHVREGRSDPLRNRDVETHGGGGVTPRFVLQFTEKAGSPRTLDDDHRPFFSTAAR